MIDRLNSLIDQMEKSIDDPDRADSLDLEFHLTLIEITGNRVLKVFSHVITMMFDREHRRRFCHHCSAYLKPGQNMRVRVHRGTVVITCHACNKKTRIHVVRPHVQST